MSTAGLLHTVPALAGTFDTMIAAEASATRRVHVADGWLLATARRHGITAAVQDAVTAHVRHLVDDGADAVLVTCSSIGEAAETAAATVDVPVLRVDAPMARSAVETAAAGAGRIAVLATLSSTLGPTGRLVERAAHGAGTPVEVVAQVVSGAAEAADAGDRGRVDELVAAAVAAAAREADVIVLAQASMAGAAELARVAVPVLTSPRGGVRALLDVLHERATAGAAGEVGPVTPGVHLLAYADRLGGTLDGVRTLLTEGPLAAFSGVHLLPFFVPYDGPDAGFDPVDHDAVDPRLGTWADVRALADAGLELTADLIVNHTSAQSMQFRDWLARGDASPYAGMYLTFDAVFPDGANEAGITAFYRPRPGLPFTPYQLADGSRRLVWTTFLPSQVDLDVDHPAAQRYLLAILETFAASGVREIRLDAVGYAIKTPGTDSFLTEHTLRFVERITALAHDLGQRVLVEVHGHYTQQQRIAPLVDHVYDFALSPLLLHALGTGDVERLAHWLHIRPENAVTVLDTHDGIGIIDAGPAGELPGLLTEDEMAAIFARAERLTGGESARASRRPAWARLPHQINSTFLAVLGGDPASYVLARAVQLFLPGQAQIYYVGLLGGRNDMARFERTGEGREVNRHAYGREELAAALDGEVARAQLALVAVRTSHPAFTGTFSFEVTGVHSIELRWTAGEFGASLRADVTPGRPGFRVELAGPDGVQVATSVAEITALATVAT